MVAMATDSYLLKTPQAPCHAPPCRHKKVSLRPTSCTVVVTLVLLTCAVLGLAGFAYYQFTELSTLRVDMAVLAADANRAHVRIDTLSPEWELLNTAISLRGDHPYGGRDDEIDADPDEYDEDLKGDLDDSLEPIYPDIEETNIENRAQNPSSEGDGAATVARLEPAGSLYFGRVTAATTLAPTTPITTTPSPIEPDLPDGENDDDRRRRREVPSTFDRRGGRPDARLRLYHMLQSPVAAAAPPPADQWSIHGERQPSARGQPLTQPMYAEHAPMAFMTPPHHRLGAITTPSPSLIAMRRSRVMDADGHRHYRGREHAARRHHHEQQQQHQQQQGVTQDASRDVDAGQWRSRWQPLPRGAAVPAPPVLAHAEAEERARQPLARPTHYLPQPPPQLEQGPWRGPWRGRGVRVTDTFQR